MIHRASFRCCFAVVATLVASACCTRELTTDGFAWPEDVECPAPDEAAFYMTGYVGSHECGPKLIRVDGPAERTDDGCSYRVVVEDCACNDPH